MWQLGSKFQGTTDQPSQLSNLLAAGDASGSKMSSHNSNSANDPRQPSAAKPFVAPAVAPQDLPVDYSGFVAVVFGVAGVMFRYKLSSWLAIIFCAQSLANMRNIENDLKQISMAMMFAIMGLVTNYLGPARPSTQS